MEPRPAPDDPRPARNAAPFPAATGPAAQPAGKAEPAPALRIAPTASDPCFCGRRLLRAPRKAGARAAAQTPAAPGYAPSNLQ